MDCANWLPHTTSFTAASTATLDTGACVTMSSHARHRNSTVFHAGMPDSE
jgi:hypothetical protein